ncbi:uncharacterized protein LOC114181643 [Vigna unguiculata]|uniref:uncharacterized protein LOC114181643 n=1 Tax=Vigna unguiculata TaxID=3917 RepID=UPI001016D9C3|nr:uncharacterized protein LOC114181643 [Vigna unguiculata]XP_027923953.1 uncharacterized protein LOC114181643 [Vigna unguiculata]
MTAGIGMGRMSKRWHNWLIEHVRSVETFATVVSSRSDKRLRNEKAKVFPCPMEEHDALIDIRTHVDEAHTDMLMLKSTNQKGFGVYISVVGVPHFFLDTRDLKYCDHCICILF